MNACTLCGGNAGRLNEQGAHHLCAARQAVGLPTPSLGKRCDGCNGSGRNPGSDAGPMLFLDLGPRAIEQAVDAWAPPCGACAGRGHTGSE